MPTGPPSEELGPVGNPVTVRVILTVVRRDMAEWEVVGEEENPVCDGGAEEVAPVPRKEDEGCTGDPSVLFDPADVEDDGP